MLLKSRASLTCFRACFLPGRAKDLSALRYRTFLSLVITIFDTAGLCHLPHTPQKTILYHLTCSKALITTSTFFFFCYFEWQISFLSLSLARSLSLPLSRFSQVLSADVSKLSWTIYSIYRNTNEELWVHYRLSSKHFDSYIHAVKAVIKTQARFAF